MGVRATHAQAEPASVVDAEPRDARELVIAMTAFPAVGIRRDHLVECVSVLLCAVHPLQGWLSGGVPDALHAKVCPIYGAVENWLVGFFLPTLIAYKVANAIWIIELQ